MNPNLFPAHQKKLIESVLQAIDCPSTTIIQIYGFCFVGKTELVYLVLREMKRKESIEVKHLSCKENFGDILNYLNLTGKNIIALDDFDSLPDTNKSELFNLMKNASITSPNTTFILVFRGLKPILTNGLHTKQFQMLPLSKSNAIELFKSQCSLKLKPNYEWMINTLLERCCGFPSVICKLAKNLSLFSNQQAFEDCFENFEIPDEYLACIGGMLETTSIAVQNLLAKLSRSHVQFTYDHLRQQVECSINGNSENLCLVIRELELIIENENHTYSLQPIVKQVYNPSSRRLVNQSSHNSICRVKSPHYARLEQCHIIGEILLTAGNYLQSNKFGQVHNILVDQKYLIETLFGKALHSDGGHSYFKCLFHISEKASKIISLHPRRAVDFYNCCYDMSRQFGSEDEQALLQYRIGQSLIRHSVGKNLSLGEEHCKEALKTFQALQQGFRIIKVNTTLAMISYWKGCWEDAIRYSYTAIRTNADVSGKEEKFAKTFCKNMLPYNYMCLGFTEKGTEIADELLNDPDTAYHPVLGIVLCSEAWSYYLKGDKNTSLAIYKRALSKLRENYLEKNRWVVPMCYIADLTSDLHEEHEKSLKIICEAEEYQKEFCTGHINLSRVELVKAKIYLRKGDLSTATQILESAEKTMTVSGSVHYILVDIHMYLAHCYIVNGQTDLATKKFVEIKKSLTKRPDENSCKSAVQKHFELQNQRNLLNVDSCKVCMDINKHNRQVKSREKEEEHLSNEIRTLSEPKLTEEWRCPHPESGCH